MATSRGKRSRDKGRRGERKVIDWLQPILSEKFPCAFIELKRNAMQSDGGGPDIVGLPTLSIEVKNVETDRPAEIERWWNQACDQRTPNTQPVLLYMRRNRPIRARLNARIEVFKRQNVYAVIDIDAKAFEEWIVCHVAGSGHGCSR